MRAALLLAVCTFALPTLAGAEELRYALRVSPEALAEVRRAEFSCEQKITDSVLGTEITGTAKTNGKCAIESAGGGELRIVIRGQSVSKTQGTNGPAIIDSTTTTTFTATAPLRYETKNGFVSGEITIEAESAMNTDNIRSTQTGVAGSVVRKLAAKKVAAAKPEAEQRAKELAVKRIKSEVTPEIAARLKKLNAACQPLTPVLAMLDAKNDAPSLHAYEGSLIVCSCVADAKQLASIPKAKHGTEVLIAADGVDDTLEDKLTASATHKVTPADVWWVVHTSDGAKLATD